MSILELLLARHGQSEANRETRFGGHGTTPLSPEGEGQAKLLAALLVSEPPLTAAYVSDLPRARSTANPTAVATGVRVVETSALRERGTGAFTGLSYAEARELDAAAFEALVVHRDPSARAPDGENLEDVHARLVPVLAEIRSLVVGRILVVSHAFTLNVMMRALLAIPTHVSNVGFHTDPCGLHRLEVHAGGRVFVRALNDTRHLRG